jgi:hypothetical protein
MNSRINGAVTIKRVPAAQLTGKTKVKMAAGIIMARAICGR